MNLSEVLSQLSAPFTRRLVKWRVFEVEAEKGRARIAPYVSGVAIMDRLDEVVGPDNWTYDFELLADGTVKGKLTVLGVTKCNRGAIEGNNVSASDKDKGNATDGLKRAAVLFGIGRYLARIRSTWVPYDPGARSFEPPPLPDWALPADETGKAPTGSTGTRAIPTDIKEPGKDKMPPKEVEASAPAPHQEQAAQACPVSAGDFWALASEALKAGLPNGEIQAIAEGAEGNWKAATEELRQRMSGEENDDQPDWVRQLGEDDPEELLTELFGS